MGTLDNTGIKRSNAFLRRRRRKDTFAFWQTAHRDVTLGGHQLLSFNAGSSVYMDKEEEEESTFPHSIRPRTRGAGERDDSMADVQN